MRVSGDDPGSAAKPKTPVRSMVLPRLVMRAARLGI